MATLPDGSKVLVDQNGSVRVRTGKLDEDWSMSGMIHITDGIQYVTGVQTDPSFWAPANLTKLRQTYEGMYCWTKSGDSWYGVTMVALGYARWEGEKTNCVPECVRVAEMLK